MKADGLVNGSVLNYFCFMKKDSAKSGDMRPADSIASLVGEVACTNTALRRAARRLGNLYDDAVAPSGLKATQVALMTRIAQFAESIDHEGPTLQELADQLAVGLSALTHALGPLVRDGLVKLRADARDGRVKRGVLTKPGIARLKEALLLWASANRKVEAVMGNEEAQKLRAMADFVSSDAFLEAYSSH
jgi:DNA-binding MarR family transcriptional regulator